MTFLLHFSNSYLADVSSEGNLQTSLQTLIAVTYRLPCPTGQTFLAKFSFHYFDGRPLELVLRK